MKTILLLALVAACGSKEAPAPAPSPKEPVAGPKGTVEARTFKSEALGVDKEYMVYLPAGYADKPSGKWPVLYYLHGLTGDEKSWLKGGHIDQAADALGLQAIIVMPDGDDGFYADSPRAIDYDACMMDGTGLFVPQRQSHAHTCVRHHMYETYIAKDLIGDVDAHYHTIATREGRGIAGMSMGGLGALELSMRHPDLFAAAASHSGVDALLYVGPHPFQAGKATLLDDVTQWGAAVGEIGAWVRGIYGTNRAYWLSYDPAALAAKVEPGKPALYLDCGTEDEFLLMDAMQYLHEVLVARKIEHAYFIGPGHHDFGFWIPRLPESLKFLREHVAKPS
jgi:S-formylglutathione hydrolase FrmB